MIAVISCFVNTINHYSFLFYHNDSGSVLMILAVTFYALTHHYAFRQFPSCCFIEYCFDRHKNYLVARINQQLPPISLFSAGERLSRGSQWPSTGYACEVNQA